MRARLRRIKSVFFSKKCILNLFYMLCFHEREELAHSFSAATHTGCVPHSMYIHRLLSLLNVLVEFWREWIFGHYIRS